MSIITDRWPTKYNQIIVTDKLSASHGDKELEEALGGIDDQHPQECEFLLSSEPYKGATCLH